MKPLNDLRFDKKFPIKDHKYNSNDFLFAILILMGIERGEAYRLALRQFGYPFTVINNEKAVEKWKEEVDTNYNNATAVLGSEKMKDLILYLRPEINEHIAEYVFKNRKVFNCVPLEKIDAVQAENETLKDKIKKLEKAGNSFMIDKLSPQEMESILVKIIRNSKDNPDDLKNLKDFSKLYIDKYMPKVLEDEDDTNRVIVKAFAKKDGVCSNCNKEIDILLTAPFKCPYCLTEFDLRPKNPLI